jgi:hypothetical protein
VDPWAWADEVLGMTLTFVRGPSLREVGDVLRFRWDTERTTTWDEAQDQHDFGRIAYAVQVADLDGWTVLVEPNGYAAATPDVVAGLSRGGTAVSVFWNANAHTGFVLAREGDVVRSFDPLLFELGPRGEPLPEEHGLPFGRPGAGLARAALTLAERLTGVRVERDWLMEGTRRTWTTAPALPRPAGGGLRAQHDAPPAGAADGASQGERGGLSR